MIHVGCQCGGVIVFLHAPQLHQSGSCAKCGKRYQWDGDAGSLRTPAPGKRTGLFAAVGRLLGFK